MTLMSRTTEMFGPVYPDLPSVKKFRRMAKGGVASMPQAMRRAYGEAVEKAILAKQRAELQRELPSHRCHCASGTNQNDGRKISAAMRAKQRAALLAYPSAERRARPAHVWQTMYEQAMADKRARQQMPLAA
jgi:hypothetical protein